jgi:hypothetical protein
MAGPMSPEDAQRWLDDWESSAPTKLAQARQLAEQVAQLSLTAANQDGSVEVTVDSAGVMTGLRLSEATRKRPADDVSQEILTVMRRAQAKLAARVSDIAAATVGADSESGRALISTFERRYPAVAADESDRDIGLGRDSEFGSATNWRGRGR